MISGKIRKSRGIALLMTLSILALLTVSLSNVFRNTTKELQMSTHDENLFYLDFLNRSIFKAFLLSLKELGPNQIRVLTRDFIPKGVPIPIADEFQDGALMDPYIKSLDHYFYLNQTYNLVNGAIFRDIVGNVIKQQNKANPPADYVIYDFVGKLSDFIDNDDEVAFRNILSGAESYQNVDPPFQIKNQSLDFLSELRLLPPFREIGLTKEAMENLDLPVRVIGSTTDTLCRIGNFNLNFLSKDQDKLRAELNSYSELFLGLEPYSQGNCEYNYISDPNNMEAIANLAVNKNAKIVPEPFKIPLSDDTDWVETMDALQLNQARSKFQPFFSSRSKYVEVGYKVLIDVYQISIKSQLEIEYGSSSSDKPKSIKILSYQEFL